jgi:hypothetical protein
MLYAFIALAAIAGAIFVQRWRARVMLMRLHWRPDVSFAKFNDLVRDYLIRQNWDVRRDIDVTDKMSALKEGRTIRVVCMCSIRQPSLISVRDLTEYAQQPGTRPLVCVTAHAAPIDVKQAATPLIIFLHFSELWIFGKPLAELNAIINKATKSGLVLPNVE